MAVTASRPWEMDVRQIGLDRTALFWGVLAVVLTLALVVLGSSGRQLQYLYRIDV